MIYVFSVPQGYAIEYVVSGHYFVGSFVTADDALRAAWARWPGVPALIYTRRP